MKASGNFTAESPMVAGLEAFLVTLKSLIQESVFITTFQQIKNG